MKKILIILIFLLFSINVFAEPLEVTIEIREVLLNQGTLIIAIYNSKTNYKKNIPCKELKAESTSETIIIKENLPSGEYVISLFQDKNGNGKLDTHIFRIPKEPIGFTNYTRKTIPGGWRKLKTKVDEENRSIKIKMIHFGGK